MISEAFKALDDWFLSPQGEAVSLAFVEQLKPLNDLLFTMKGQHLIQLGRGGCSPWLQLLDYKNKWCVVPEPTDFAFPRHTIIAVPKQLPFESRSVDCVVSPLALETCKGSQHPLHELDRVLKPMGYLVILGVNLTSLWALAMRWGRLPGIPSGAIHPYSLFKLKLALSHYGYSICHLAPFYYIPPVKRTGLIQRLEIFNELGKMISPCPSGFYCMVVQKYVPQSLGTSAQAKYWRTAEGVA